MSALDWGGALESCSWALIHFLWEGVAITGVAAVGLQVLRHRAPSTRYCWALACFLALVIAPASHFVWLQSEGSAVVTSRETSSSVHAFPAAGIANLGVVRSIPEAADPALRLPPSRLFHISVVVAWLCGQFAVSLRLCASAVFLWRVHRRAKPVKKEIRARAVKLARKLGIERPQVKTSTLAAGAFAAGFLRRVIVVPVAWLNEMTPDMLDAVIAHELAHLRRHDLWVNLFQRIVETVLFFHPAVWWLSCKIRQEREFCCDELAIRITRQQGLYAKTLEHVARRSMVGPGILATQMGDDRMSILRRVRFVLGDTSSATPTGWWPAGLLAMLIPCGLVWLAHTTSSAADEEARPSVSVARVARATDIQPEQPIPLRADDAAAVSSSGFDWTLGQYFIEPPDIVLIQGIQAENTPAYELQENDIVTVVVTGTAPQRPISGPFLIETSGSVNLGPGYGGVAITGMTTADAAERIHRHLVRQDADRNFEVAVSIQQASWSSVVAGEHLVGPDGTINLGVYGRVYIAGMTPTIAKRTIEAHLARFVANPAITFDVLVNNSKFFYIIREGAAGEGDEVIRSSVTGNETVLDALSMLGGIRNTSLYHFHINRPSEKTGGDILPVDLSAIARKGDTTTNYQLLPGDRLFVSPKSKSKSGGVLRAEWHTHPSIPIMGPLTSGGSAEVLEPPTDEEILSIIRVASPNSPLLLPKNQNQLHIEKTLVADYVDPPKEYPLIGCAQLHHAHYKCRVELPAEKDRAFLNRAEECERTFYIDHTHLHAGSDLRAAPPAREVASVFAEPEPVDTRAAEMYAETYYVGDLVVPIKPPSFSSDGVRERHDRGQADFETLINHITATIEPSSWEAVGGPGVIKPFKGNLSLVISQTKSVHDAVVELLQQFRRLQDVQVIMKSRRLEVPSALLSRLGLSKKSMASLSSGEVQSLLEAARRDPDAREYAEQRATLFSGQFVAVEAGASEGGTPTRFSVQAVVGDDNAVHATVIGPGGSSSGSAALGNGQAILITAKGVSRSSGENSTQTVQLLSAETKVRTRSDGATKGVPSRSPYDALTR